MNSCGRAPGTVATSSNASETTEARANLAVYVSIQGQRNAPLRFLSYAEKAKYYRGKVACTGSACDQEPA
jgi:hypothetical protein